MKNFSLVLSGGAVKGFAHIGVIKVLEEYNLKPNLIVGTSMGAIVGGLYAIGKSSKQMEELALSMTKGKIQDMDPLMFFKDSMMIGNKVKLLLKDIFRGAKADKTNIPFIAISASLETGKEYRLNKGYLYKNVLASSAVPAFFPSVSINGILMSDGGAINNLPEDVANDMHPKTPILSVDVLADYQNQIDNSKFKIMSRVLNMVSLLQTTVKIYKKNYADIRLEIPLPNIGLLDFTEENIKLAISRGEEYMRKHIDELLKLVKN